MDVRPLIHDERRTLLALLGDLDAQDWEAPSLCADWRVRDVVGHLVAELSLSAISSAVGLARHRFRMNEYIGVTGRQWGKQPIAELRERLATNIESDRRPPSTAFEGVLMDTIIHQQDIRRPLGRDRAIAEQPLRIALTHIVDHGKPLPGKERAAGLRLDADDIDWSHGEGPEVTGPGEALLLACAGRSSVLPELTGDGRQILAERLA